MLVDYTKIKGRMVCAPETPEETRRLKDMCLSAVYKKDTGVWSVEDSLVNRFILGLPYEIEAPSVSPRDIIFPTLPLRDFQKADLDKIIKIKNHLNGNRPGYGKTVEALVYSGLIGAKKILVLCPKSVKYQWYNQFQTWRPDLHVDSFSITPRKGFLAMSQQSTCIVITNYEQLLNEKVLQGLKSTSWDLVIADEIHRIRNYKRDKNGRPKSKMSFAAKSLPGTARVGLTGSPIMNKPDNLWGIFWWINPWYFGNSYWQFVEHFCHVREDFFGKKIEGLTHNEEMANILHEVVDLLMVRNADNMVGVGIQEEDVPLEMYPEQAKIYKDLKGLVIKELEKVGISVANGMSQLMKMQQVTSNTSLFDLKANPKFEWIKDFLDDNTDLKLLVFSRFRETIEALNSYLGEDIVTTIHGKVSDEQREVEKTQFIADARKRVLTGTIGAMSESIDGLQHVCHDVVFIDKMWNPEENNQAMRRVHRWGQEHMVNVWTLMYRKTVDEKVGKINIAKLDDIKAVLD